MIEYRSKRPPTHSELDEKQHRIDELQSELIRLQSLAVQEANIRRLHPAVMDAYEQYRVTLRLVT